jgi:hypothetical protein
MNWWLMESISGKLGLIVRRILFSRTVSFSKIGRLHLGPNIVDDADKENVIVFQSEYFIIKSMSWAHTMVQKLERFKREDRSDIKAIIRHLAELKDIQFNSATEAFQWLKRKLPNYVYKGVSLRPYSIALINHVNHTTLHYSTLMDSRPWHQEPKRG